MIHGGFKHLIYNNIYTCLHFLHFVINQLVSRLALHRKLLILKGNVNFTFFTVLKRMPSIKRVAKQVK